MPDASATGHLHVLRALAAGREVHLFLLHPSPGLWEAVARATEHGRPVIRRSSDVTAQLPANRLLASWGQDAREMQLVLAGNDDHVDHHHALEHRSDTLLARIQADVRADRSPPGGPLPGHEDERPLLDPDDLSVQVHACHGRARQVEVVRDAILHQLEEDPSLEPRDVIVMCPDIETFAPLSRRPSPRVRYPATTSSTRSRPRSARLICGSGLRTDRYARPTLCSAWSPS